MTIKLHIAIFDVKRYYIHNAEKILNFYYIRKCEKMLTIINLQLGLLI